MHIETKGDFMDTLTSDIRFALRTFKRSPGVITAAVVSLALGIGANVTIFSATDVCIFRPLPYEEADRLLHVFQIHPGARAERFDEAARHFEECRRRKYPFYASYSQLAASYMGLGRFEEGKRVMEDYLEQNPSQAAAHYTFASYLTRGGRLEEALETLEKAESLGAFPFFSTGVLWTVSVLRDDLEGAEKIARQGRMSENRDERFFGSRQLAITRIIQGRSEDALAILNETEQIFSEPDNRTAFAHNTTAHILIDQGQPKPALEQAQKAQIDGKGDYPEWEGLFLASLALDKLGRWEDAEKTAETLQLKAESLPTEKEKRRYHHLIKELTLLRGDARTAVRELENAEAMLPAGALDLEYRLAQHVPIWYSLARAYLASGDEAKATIWFERIAESG